MASSIEDSKKYLRYQINPILEQLVAALMRAQPETPVPFMKDWLIREGPSLQKKINDRLRSRPEGLKSTSESGNEDENKDSVKMELAEQKKSEPPPKRTARTSVSAEVYGEYNKKKPFTPPVYPKTTEQRARILQKISNSFLFSNCDQKDKDIIVNAMQIVNFPGGTRIITQGEKGDHLFVIDSGILDCTKITETGQNLHLVTYGPGDAFGELALLYNAPRAATIDSRTDCTLLSLDRETFNNVVKDSVSKRRQMFDEFLRKVELFDSLNQTERDKIGDVMQSRIFHDGEFIIKEGEEGNTFFCIQSGKAKAFKLNPATRRQDLVHEYHEYEYFGELSLLKDTPRAASIVADGNCTVAFIDRPAFKRLFGPLEEILKRNSKRYDEYVLQK